ncbi:hypothetical protein FGIG_10561 [Fasciola gigantica]|uniref:Uncharacterized protein n=1 Tax=Fasciola gigantica TaxID=46835 RepID=A0A504YP70_FASGI|nr:hypothetical protein FGIG_10561 [Fasciola gigantica]
MATVQRFSATEAGNSSPTDGHTHTDSDGMSTTIKGPWCLGELGLEIMTLHLDIAGCQTGHLYRQEAVVSQRHVPPTWRIGYTSQEDEVLIPPAASSAMATMAYFCDDEVLFGD